MSELYSTSEQVIDCKGLTLTVINRTPVLSAAEREKARQRIDAQLYQVFMKYVTT